MNSFAPAGARWRSRCAAARDRARAVPGVSSGDRPLCRRARRLDRARSGKAGDPCRRAPEPTDAEREAYIRQAKACLPQRVAYYSERMGLYPTQVRITGARTRFGSCSSQGHICFSWRLMQYPPEADRLRRRARAGAPALHEPRRGVLRASSRAICLDWKAAARCCGREKAHRRTGCPPVRFSQLVKRCRDYI